MPTYAELLQAGEARLHTSGIGTPRLDGELLLARAAAITRAGLFGRLQADVPADVAATFEALLARRAQREPLAYITGAQEFWSLSFAVSPAVLVPRPETELLVELACQLLERDASERAASAAAEPTWICDVGTGSGCIAVALAQELPDARIVAVDVSVDALAVAERNAAEHGVADRILCVESDLFDGLDPATRFDAIVSNPPYLAPGDFTQPELRFEPHTALSGGSDGLEAISRLIEAAPSRLHTGGFLIVEIGAGQAKDAEELAREAHLVEVRIVPDLAGLPRALVARSNLHARL
jgi:release factor glutamine methyltransferase